MNNFENFFKFTKNDITIGYRSIAKQEGNYASKI